MLTTWTSTTWGLTDGQFLWPYGAACAAAAAAIWSSWRRAVGRDERRNDPLPDLDLLTLAMLGGGTQLAITTAATKLCRDGALNGDESTRTLAASGELAPGAGGLEREIHAAVRGRPGISPKELRRAVENGDAVQSMRSALIERGLMLADSQVASLRRLWLLLAALTALGVWRLFAAPAPHGGLVIAVGALVVATLWLVRRRPVATARGRNLLERARNERADLRRHPVAAESALSVALFGAAALWAADPAIATTLGVPREEDARLAGGNRWGWSGGGACSVGVDSGGGCGGGGGGCGGGCGGG